MSQIIKALKKAQELRKKEQISNDGERKVPVSRISVSEMPSAQMPLVDIVPVKNEPLPEVPKTFWNNLIPILAITAFLMSIAAFITVMGVESKNKRTNDLVTAINKAKIVSNGQINDIGLRLENETKDLKEQIDHVSSNSRDDYDKLKEAIIDDKQQIAFLNDESKKINQKIETISISMTQAASQVKDKTIPTGGN